MAEQKIIAVIGATGAQGGGLVRAIQADASGQFRARAITRNANSDKAKALAALGAEVVEADLSKPETLRAAFEGAHGAFLVTFFWDHYSPERELADARAMAEAAKAAGVKHVIWSTLEDTRRLVPLHDDRLPTLQGKYKVPHFDAKGEADAIFANLGVPTSFLYASFYWDNFIYFGMGPKPDGSGRYALSFPIGQSKMAGVAAEDIGKCALGVFKQGENAIGRSFGVAGEQLTGGEMAAAFSKTLGIDVYYNEMTPAAYRALGFPGSDDLGNMFQIYRDFDTELNNLRDVATSRRLNPELKDFATWLEANKAAIPLT